MVDRNVFFINDHYEITNWDQSFTLENENSVVVPIVQNQVIILWFRKYRLFQNNILILEIGGQKQSYTTYSLENIKRVISENENQNIEELFQRRDKIENDNN